MNKNLTIVLPSYRSSNLILNHVKKLSDKYKIIIIENSFDKNLAKILKQNYKNVNIYLRKNIGFGRAINFASKKKLRKTKYSKTRFFSFFLHTNRFYMHLGAFEGIWSDVTLFVILRANK